jgi:choline dehydrogenase-like flavoprotein
MIHLRGSPKDFDNWARITGDEGWSYENVLRHFCSYEHFVGTTTDSKKFKKIYIFLERREF